MILATIDPRKGRVEPAANQSTAAKPVHFLIYFRFYGNNLFATAAR
jgi:hypothetical protein